MNWIVVSSVITAIALVVQIAILVALFFELRKTTTKINQLSSELQARIGAGRLVAGRERQTNCRESPG